VYHNAVSKGELVREGRERVFHMIISSRPYSHELGVSFRAGHGTISREVTRPVRDGPSMFVITFDA